MEVAGAWWRRRPVTWSDGYLSRSSEWLHDSVYSPNRQRSGQLPLPAIRLVTVKMVWKEAPHAVT